ncbi:MAG: ATP-binding protein [Myxococcota bacterium]
MEESKMAPVPDLLSESVFGYTIHSFLLLFLAHSLITGDWVSAALQAVLLLAVVVMWQARRAIGLSTLAHVFCAIAVSYQLLLLYLSQPAPNIGLIWFLVVPTFAGIIGRYTHVLLWLPVCLIAMGVSWWWVSDDPAMAHPASLPNLIAVALLVSGVGVGVLVDRSRRERGLRDALDAARLQAQDRMAAEVKALRAERETAHFLATMSHELRTPLTSILLSVEELNAEASPAGNLQAKRDIAQSARTLSALLNDVLDLSKVHAGKAPLAVEPFGLVALFEDVNRLIAPQVHAVRQRLVCALPPDLEANWFGDPVRLQQVLTNLVSNAVKYTPEAGEIVLWVRRVESGLSFGVQDAGVGMEPAQIEKVFEPYVQLGEGPGTGLGLPIAKEFVEAMGGQVRVHSTPGEGSTFSFFVPTTPDGLLVISDQVEGPDLTGATVEVVEADPLILQWAQAWMGQWGASLGAGGLRFELNEMFGGTVETARVLATAVFDALGTPRSLTPVPLPVRRPPLGDATLTCVVCDDDVIVRRAIGRLLRRFGCTVLLAEDGRAALSALSANAVDCVFLDVEIGPESGVDLVRTIRGQESAYSDVPIFMLSGSGRYRDDAVAAGANHFLLKPVEPNELSSAITQIAAEKRRAERAADGR